MLTKTCRHCSRDLPATSEFFYTKSKTTSLVSKCKECQSNQDKAKRAADPEKYRAYGRLHYRERGGAETDRAYRRKLKAKDPAKFKARAKEATLRYRSTYNGYIKLLHKTAKHRALSNGREFTISDVDIFELFEKQKGLCALFNQPMTMITDRGIQATNISIDRIDPTRGYTPDNIQLVQTQANWMKSNMTMSELVSRCRAVLAIHG